MSVQNKFYTYLADKISFSSEEASQLRTIYFPLCGITSDSIKSSITPFLSGDVKTNKNHYLTKPTSIEDLRYPLRNFFIYIEGKQIVVFSDVGDQSLVEAGQLWHKVTKNYSEQGIELEALNFVPVSGENIELVRVTCRNTSKKNLKITPTSVIPIFGRALENKHDHEQVTSLLHRIQQLSRGVCVKPTMLFNEEGHKTSDVIYYVLGVDGDGKDPVGTFPTADCFYGATGTALQPEAVMDNKSSKVLSVSEIDGKEAVGALRFETIELAPDEEKVYIFSIGLAQTQEEAESNFKKFDSQEKLDKALEENKKYWHNKTHSIVFQTGDEDFNSWMQWVTLQPVLRRIYGCSFLPDHDYGKGGRGWRDIWQDLLSLILIEPDQVRDVLINNFAGVRIDGSNATIIGSEPGEFIADRNAIARVWMDHGVWPFLTILLYINQTGDEAILLEENTYFRDIQMSRTFKKDESWSLKYGNQLKDKIGNIYKGTLIEHILIEHLVQFFNVGEHNIIRLESADWNDGLDMAFDRGESVAFMSIYSGNLLAIADLLENFSEEELVLAKEINILLDSLGSQGINYGDIDEKKKLLFESYFKSVEPELSGEKVKVKVEDLVKDLRKKGNWIVGHLRRQEKMNIDSEGFKDSWFNGYYDNTGKRVEGKVDGQVRMTLTGQVFPIMSGVVEDKDVKVVDTAVRRYLKDRNLGGVRLNTNFHKEPYLDLGRAFGFAYGTKENGAVFSHMTVMYAYALYHRGCAREGYDVLHSLYLMGMDTKKSQIYPGIPEYFDGQGKGMYHYLTGSASWLVLTQLTKVFGVRGEGGDLVLAPMLVKEEFDKQGMASITCQFAGKKITVIYENSDQQDAGSYQIKKAFLNDQPIDFQPYDSYGIKIERFLIAQVDGDVILQIVMA